MLAGWSFVSTQLSRASLRVRHRLANLEGAHPITALTLVLYGANLLACCVELYRR